MAQWLHSANVSKMLRATKENEVEKNIIANAARHGTIMMIILGYRPVTQTASTGVPESSENTWKNDPRLSVSAPRLNNTPSSRPSD